MEFSELAKKLDAPIPKEFIETREQAGTTFKYLSGSYVIDRLNQVFGHGAWAFEIVELRNVFEGKVTQKSGEVFSTSYISIVKLSWTQSYTDVGYGDGTDKYSPGKAHELAVKEAVTDGLKRCARNLGRSMGLELYFKTKPEPVEDLITNICKTCGSQMKISKDAKRFWCPNFKDKTKGEHPTVLVAAV